jgi:transposase
MYSLFEKWLASGKSKTSFAKSEGIHPKTFYYWAKKFEQTPPAPRPKATPSTLEEPPQAGFHVLHVDEPSTSRLMAAIEYPGGIRLELYPGFQEASPSFVELLKTLTS